jgi:octopine/nopaline transport system permease protein
VNFQLMWESVPSLLGGLVLTLELVLLSLLLGFFVAIGIALMRLSPYRLLSAFAYTYVFVFRGTPLLVQIFLIYYGLGQFEAIRDSFLWTFFREPFWCAILAFTLNTGAYTSELIRGGIQSVPWGQIEAARACGMSRVRMFRRIVFPIAIRQALPAYGNEVILMVKASSLASTITLMEVTGIARDIISTTYAVVDIFILAGAIYLTINFLLTRALGYVEWRLSPHLRGAPQPVLAPTGIEAH